MGGGGEGGRWGGGGGEKEEGRRRGGGGGEEGRGRGGREVGVRWVGIRRNYGGESWNNLHGGRVSLCYNIESTMIMVLGLDLASFATKSCQRP